MGDVGCPRHLPQEQPFFSCGGRVWHTAGPSRQFIDTAGSSPPSFLEDLQTAMAGCSPLPTRYNSSPALTALPEELLMACFVLICCDRSQPPLAPIYEGRNSVLEQSTHFFFLQIGDRTDKVSVVRLKPARTPADATLSGHA
jgi:hypothetical protein